MKLRSQPTPTAPGPNWSQCGLRWATCSSSRRVPLPSGVSVTVTQLTAPPNSQVSATCRFGSQVVMVPPALPSTW